ncbi:UNVERIFIED_ORG: hypothetical protein M2328_002752 [Rhodococcus erythropolis]
MDSAEEPSALVTVDEFTKITGGDDVTQFRLDSVIDAVRDYCGWHIAPHRRETMVLDGNGCSVLLLRTTNIVEVHAVTECGIELPADSGFEWSQRGMIRHPSVWTDRWRAIEVDLTHGFDKTPTHLAAAIIDLAQSSIEFGGSDEPETIGPFKFGGSQGGTRLPGHVLAVLNRYRVHQVS